MSTAIMPFTVSRRHHASLTDQVVDGLRSAILAGHYQPGDTLPSLQQMADALGVSEIVTRRAVQRLVKEGVLHARAGAKTEVCGDVLQSWRGHLLYIHWSGASMYYHSILSEGLVERLHAAGVLVTTQHVDGTDFQSGFPKVQAYLGHAITLAAVEGPAQGLDTILADKGIPFIHIYGEDVPCSPLAAHGIAVSRDMALRAMHEHCLACGVRSVLEIKSTQDNRQVSPSCFDPDVFHVQAMPSNTMPGLSSPEAVERGAVVAMQAWLAGDPDLPDLIWFDDDFVARGALLAMTAHGIHIPDTVQVISLANKGLGPVFLKPVTRLEMDPAAHSEIVTQCILDRIEGKPIPMHPVELNPTFIPGETTTDNGVNSVQSVIKE